MTNDSVLLFDPAVARRQQAGLAELFQIAVSTAETATVPVARAHGPSREAVRGKHRDQRKARISLADVHHRLLVVVGMILTTATLYFAEHRLWPTNPALPGQAQEVWSRLSLLWLAPTIPALFELAGLLMYRAPRLAAGLAYSSAGVLAHRFPGTERRGAHCHDPAVPQRDAGAPAVPLCH